MIVCDIEFWSRSSGQSVNNALHPFTHHMPSGKILFRIYRKQFVFLTRNNSNLAQKTGFGDGDNLYLLTQNVEYCKLSNLARSGQRKSEKTNFTERRKIGETLY